MDDRTDGPKSRSESSSSSSSVRCSRTSTKIDDVDGKRTTVALFYKYVDVKEPREVCESHRLKCESLGLIGRLRIAREGINGTLEGDETSIQAYKSFLDESKLFRDIDYKMSENTTPYDAFGSLQVKVVKELVSLGAAKDEIGAEGGHHADPRAFHELVLRAGRDDDVLILDTRNYYEWKIGHFEKAVKPVIRNYSQFPQWVDRNIEMLKSKDVVAMYCTGGIRCETASAVLKSKGVQNVFQLKGGIHRYLETFAARDADRDDDERVLFKGKNFVFDRRRVQSVRGESRHVVVGQCDKCGCPHDRYFDETSSSEAERICCDICRGLVLACPTCMRRAPFYCDMHKEWRNITRIGIEKKIDEMRCRLRRSEEGNDGVLSRSQKRNLRKMIQYCRDQLENRLESKGRPDSSTTTPTG